MFRASRSRISQTLFALVMPIAFLLAPAGAAPAAAAGPTALINGSTVTGGLLSQEAMIATVQGFAVTVVDDATWGSMSAANFGQYDLLIAGDPTCSTTLPPGLVSSAPVYGSVVMGLAGGRTSAGNRIVVGTDPVFHDSGSTSVRATIIRDGIAYAGAQPGRTGMYFDATCAGSGPLGQSQATLDILNALSAGTDAWTIDVAPPCGGSVSLIASNPSFADLTTTSLSGWNCSVHESFPTFRTDWSALAVATDTATKPTCGVDPGTGLGACGQAYILIAGSSIVVTSQGISVTPLEATNPVGTPHTVTANVHKLGGTPPVVGALVTFSVTGVNAGATGTCLPVDCKSDASGNVSFTYPGAAGAGDDTIKASFTDDSASLQTATALKHWTSVPPLPAHLTLTKSVINTGGGTASRTAWTLSASGPTPISGVSGDPSITNAAVSAGTYLLAESGGPPTGYSASAWTCTAGALTGSSLVLAPGETASCSITNTFDPTTNRSTVDTCPPTASCVSAPITSTGGTVATITAGPGATITAGFVPFAGAGFSACKGQNPRDPLNAMVFNVTSSAQSKVLTLVVKGKGPIPICWNAPTSFRQRDGRMAKPDPLGGFTGLLPECKEKKPIGPCILSAEEHATDRPSLAETGRRKPPPPATTTIRILVPPGDPKMRA